LSFTVHSDIAFADLIPASHEVDVVEPTAGHHSPVAQWMTPALRVDHATV